MYLAVQEPWISKKTISGKQILARMEINGFV
jgi:hypothetical protein